MPGESTILRRLAIVGVCALSLAVCCGLAYWQWMRFSSAGGSFQNLGYVLQWPLFGLFPAFVFWRIRKLSKRADGRDTADTPGAGPESATQSKNLSASTELVPVATRTPALARQGAPDPHDPEDPDDAELAAYNRYLAELYARDK